MVDLGYGSEFFYVDATGRVRVRDAPALASDIGTVYALVVRAYDSAFPNMKVTSTVTVNVNRNPTAPRWANNNYVFNITDRYKSIIFYFSPSLCVSVPVVLEQY